MATITVHDAKTHLSALLRRVEAGEEIVIARGKEKEPVARLVPLEPEVRPRPLGIDLGRFDVPDDFDVPFP